MTASTFGITNTRRGRPRRNIMRAIASISGTIDLTSIMVGVIVIGVVSGIIASTVFAVIPWAQDKAATQALSAYKTAQSVAFVKTGGQYLTTDQLVEQGYLPASANASAAAATAGGSGDRIALASFTRSTVKAAPDVPTSAGTFSATVGTDGSCYVVATVSGTGRVLYTTSTDPTVRTIAATAKAPTISCAGAAFPAIAHVVLPAAPAPTVTIASAGATAHLCLDGAMTCRTAVVTGTNLAVGTYTVHLQTNAGSGWADVASFNSTSSSRSLTSGTYAQSTNSMANPGVGVQVRVEIVGPSGTVDSPAISSAAWLNLARDDSGSAY